MAAGKRFEDETFEEYRERLKLEKKMIKRYLRGRLTHCSTVLVPSASKEFKDVPRYLRPLVKLKVLGTFVKNKLGGKNK